MIEAVNAVSKVIIRIIMTIVIQVAKVPLVKLDRQGPSRYTLMPLEVEPNLNAEHHAQERVLNYTLEVSKHIKTLE